MDLYALGATHGLIVFATIIVILYSDHQGFLYFRGKKATLSLSFVNWSHRLVWLGLGLIISTGSILVSFNVERYVADPAFFLKMSFVGVLIMNGLAIGALSHKASTTPFAALSQEEQRTLLVSGALSFMGWVGAFVIGAAFL